MSLAGVDGCKAGWLAVSAETGQFATATAAIHSGIGPLLAAGHSVIAVDMPIGLEDEPSRGGRDADRAARAYLTRNAGGGVRNPWSRVFPAPSRRHLGLLAKGYHRANQVLPEGAGFTRQSFNISHKIAELDDGIPPNGPVWEVHPEVSFAALAGRTLPPKRDREGREQRRVLLTEAGFKLEALVTRLGPRTQRWGLDDLFDACIALWSANRIAQGTCCALPDRPGRDGKGHRMAIHF